MIEKKDIQVRQQDDGAKLIVIALSIVRKTATLDFQDRHDYINDQANREKIESEMRDDVLEFIYGEATKNAENLGTIVSALATALAWCSQASDFQEGGCLRKQWEAVCKPMLEAAPVGISNPEESSEGVGGEAS